MSNALLKLTFTPILPWESDPEETQRFKRILMILLLITLLFSLIIPFINITKPDRTKHTTIPPRLVKMVLEQKKVVKPKPIPVPEEKKVEEIKPEEKIKEPEKKEEVKPKEKPAEVKKTAKEVAKKHIAVFDALAEIREQDILQDLKRNQTLSNDTGKAATTTRNLITKKATEGSGGIKVATASQSSGTGSLAGQSTTKVTSDIGEAVDNTQRVNKSGNLKRSSENIQLAFERYKPEIFSIYNRALRKDPGLQGRVNFRLKIMPDGSVAECSIVSSELNNDELEKRIVARIKRINFGAMNVAIWNETYLINFFPS